jgi:hypothetical protein
MPLRFLKTVAFTLQVVLCLVLYDLLVSGITGATSVPELLALKLFDFSAYGWQSHFIQISTASPGHCIQLSGSIGCSFAEFAQPSRFCFVINS